MQLSVYANHLSGAPTQRFDIAPGSTAQRDLDIDPLRTDNGSYDISVRPTVQRALENGRPSATG